MRTRERHSERNEWNRDKKAQSPSLFFIRYFLNLDSYENLIKKSEVKVINFTLVIYIYNKI